MMIRYDMITCFVVRPDASGRSYELLQLHRSPADFMGNTWQIIRGGVDADESPIAAALRELKEEAGLTPVEFYRLGMVETFYIPQDDSIWHSVSFCAVVSRNQFVQLNDEHDDFRWLGIDEFKANCMWASERLVLDSLILDILQDGLSKPFLKIPLAPG